MAPLYRNLLCAVVGILLLSASATAKVIYVSPDGNDLNDGLSWARAKRTVTAALDIAASRDEIWVRFGVYNERITLKSGVSLYGGFRGTESSLSERPTFPRPSPDPYETVLDGGGLPRVVATPGIAGEPYRLDGFTVRNGGGNYPSAAVYLLGKAADYLTVANCRIVDSMPGLAFVCNGGSPYFENCSVENAAGIFCMNSSIALKGCVFKGAGSVSFMECTPALDGCLVEGGSMGFYDSQAVLYNCTYNMCGVGASSSSCYPAAALLVDRCSFSNGGVGVSAGLLYITNSRFEGGQGPAVSQSYPGEIVMENCTISGKRAGWTGAIQVSSGTFINCVISNNTGSDAGGVQVGGKATFINCTISDNTADRGNGGGVFVSGHITFTNCVISGNTAKEYGGGVYVYGGGEITFVDCTISQNMAGKEGGGVYLPARSAATFRGCVLSDNGYHGVYCAQYAGIEMTGCTLQDWVYFSYEDWSGVATFDNCRMVTAYIEGNRLLHLTNCFLEWTWVQGGKLHLTGCKARRSSIRASGELLLTDCSICDGESIISDGGQNVITRCVIANNYSRESGGGISIRNWYAGLEISDSIIANNRSEGYGGGVFMRMYSLLRARNCLIMGNRAAQAGGGVYSPHASLVNCSLLYNHASAGGGLSSEGSEVVNCLIAFNEGGGMSSVYASGDYWFRFNCVWQNFPYDVQKGGTVYDPTGRNGNISADPLIAGGHLLPGSPCIDAGDNSAVTTERDVDGEARIAGDRVDIGADEFHSPILQGRLFFNDRVDWAMPGAVDIELRTTGMPEMRTVSVDPLGGFVIPHPPADLLALSVKPLSYLRRTVEVDVSGGDVLGMELDLVNGDIDDDNEVTLFDFGRLVAVFGAWGDGPLTYRADLDGDNEVTLFDFGILVRNFGEIGDE